MLTNIVVYDVFAEALAAAKAADGTFDPATIRVYLVASASLKPDGSGFISKTQPANGLDAAKTVTSWSAVSRDPDGAVFITSNLLSWLPTADPVSESVRGVMIASSASFDAPLVYCEFASPESVSYANQPTNVVLELGYAEKEFYFQARLVPNGE